MDRLQQLLEFYKEDPNDPFTIYGLALEYQNQNHIKARELFENLLNQHPNYLPTYYSFGKFLEMLGENENAKETFLKGQSVAGDQNNHKALRELIAAYQQLTDEDLY